MFWLITVKVKMTEQPQQPADLSATLAAISANIQHLQDSINSIHDYNNKNIKLMQDSNNKNIQAIRDDTKQQNKNIHEENKKKIFTMVHEQS